MRHWGSLSEKGRWSGRDLAAASWRAQLEPELHPGSVLLSGLLSHSCAAGNAMRFSGQSLHVNLCSLLLTLSGLTLTQISGAAVVELIWAECSQSAVFWVDAQCSGDGHFLMNWIQVCSGQFLVGPMLKLQLPRAPSFHGQLLKRKRPNEIT